MAQDMSTLPEPSRIFQKYVYSCSPAIITLVLSVLVYAICSPGLMSYDSMYQYRQAVAGEYSNWHPPIMSMLLSGLLAMGGDIHWLMLIQCMLGMFGLRSLVKNFLLLFYDQVFSVAAAKWVSLICLIVLLIPLSPFMFYLMTYWKDSWELILLLWIGAGLFRIFSRAESMSSTRFAAWMLCLVLMMSLFGMVRYNAVLALPVLGAALWVMLKKRRPMVLKIAWLILIVPLVVSLGSERLINEIGHVKKEYPEHALMAYELIGMCFLGDEYCEEIPYTKQFVKLDTFREYYKWGTVSLLAREPRLANPEIVDQGDALREEYWSEVARHPFQMAANKLKAYWNLLGFRKTYYFFHNSIDKNEFGIEPNQRFETLRNFLMTVADHVSRNDLFRWFFGVHAVWMVANIIWIGWGIAQYRKKKGLKFVLLVTLLASTLGYSLSYIMATTDYDFRYLYPSSLFVQVVTIAAATAKLLPKLCHTSPS